MSQRDVFLSSEGDAWYFRNKSRLGENLWEIDVLSKYVKKSDSNRILEVGCSSGIKLATLISQMGGEGYGIDPSSEAIIDAQKNYTDSRLNFARGTVDQLDFESNFFDLIYVAFCFYLVDRNLLPRAVSELNRCLKKGGMVAIADFDPGREYDLPYSHFPGISTFKRNYGNPFLELGYHLAAKESFDHARKEVGFSYEENDRVSIQLLVKP